MSTTDNPYTPPPPSTALDVEPAARFASTAEVPRAVIALLAQTRPWVKLLSVLFFVILVALAVLGAVLAAVSPAKFKPASLAPLIVVFLIYIAPARYLWLYARGIQRLLDGGGQGALEEALTNQKSFWKFSGVLGLIMVCIYALGLVFGGLTAFLGHARGGS